MHFLTIEELTQLKVPDRLINDLDKAHAKLLEVQTKILSNVRNEKLDEVIEECRICRRRLLKVYMLISIEIKDKQLFEYYQKEEKECRS